MTCSRLVAMLAAFLTALAARATTVPLVSHGDAWRYHCGTNAPQANWTNAPDASLDATWATGNGGFGYADDGGQETNNCQTILSNMKNLYTTVYIRKQFTITNALSGDARLGLRMDWDDGFIAWLDGRYLTNRNVSGAPAVPYYTNTASATHESSLGSSGLPAETYDFGPATNRLAPGTHTLAMVGLNRPISSTDFILVADLYLTLTNPPMTLVSNTTWSATNSPYTFSNSVVVASNATLTVEPGVTARFGQGYGLTVRGRLLADGTESQPITFTRNPGDTTWERIMFVAAEDSRLTHCIIEYCNCVGDHKDYYPTNCGPPFLFGPRNYHEAVVVLAGHVDFEGCSFTNLPDTSATAAGDAMAIVSDDTNHPGPASATVRNCHFIRIGQGVHTRYAYVLVENCIFKDKHGDNDDVDLYGESVPPCIVRSNLFLYPSYDDRINPTRCSVWIYGNTIYGSTDHGIVLRDVSRPVVFNNVLYGCSAGGISVQNGCEALIANNTLINCPNALKMFDHLDRITPPYCLTPTSGVATLVNNVIWTSTPALNLAGNAFGTLYANVAHCNIQGGTSNASLGTKGVLAVGPGNFNLNPLFTNAAATNFHLLAGSPCIDAGTNQTWLGSNLAPIVTFDFDGTPRPLDGNGDGTARLDVGAYEFFLPTADSNGDGIPDGWCQRYGFHPLDGGVAPDDPDHDAFTTFQEYVADTDPTRGVSAFRIAALSNLPPGTVYFLGSSNRVYTLSYQATPGGGREPPTDWTNVAGQVDVPGTGGTQSLSDASSGPQRFYRVGVKIP